MKMSSFKNRRFIAKTMSGFCIKKKKQTRKPYTQGVGSRYFPVAVLTSGSIHMDRDWFSERILWDMPLAETEEPWPPHLVLCFPCFLLSKLPTPETSKVSTRIRGGLLQLLLNRGNQSLQTAFPELPERNPYWFPLRKNEDLFISTFSSVHGRGHVSVP